MRSTGLSTSEIYTQTTGGIPVNRTDRRTRKRLTIYRLMRITRDHMIIWSPGVQCGAGVVERAQPKVEVPRLCSRPPYLGSEKYDR
jgi:hypothetical protein